MLRTAGLLLICSSLCLCFYQANRSHCEEPFYFQCENLHCLPASFICDGENDCLDNSDEKDCISNLNLHFNHFKCAEDEFTCKNENQCIPIDNFCNGHTDCDDESDESEDCTKKLNCDGKFRCMDNHCILNSWVCDKLKDCPDGSDELNCDKMLAHNCNSSRQYRCTNNRCIHIEAVCNENNDCGDGSDEGLNCTVNCTLKCDHECKKTPRGSKCICKPGYELQNNITCIDINECEDPFTQYGICDQRCMNTVGSYRCFCDTGYALQDDKKTCKAEGGEATLVYTLSNEIRGFYMDSQMYFLVADNMTLVESVTVDRDYVYWIDSMPDKVIVRMDSNGKRDIVIPYGLDEMSEVVVDWITGNIYFISEWEESIGVCNSNGLLCTIIERGTGPNGIVLLPNEGLMFWSAHVKSKEYGQILKAGMDGKNKVQFVTSDWPKALTIDYPNNRLYWIDFKAHTIESILLNGKDRRIILNNIEVSFSIAIFENKLFWSSLFTITSCDKFSGKNKLTKVHTSNHAYSIHIDHSSLKPNIQNPCHPNPCSQLCILSQNNSYTCACTLDKKLDANNHTCQELKKLPQLIIIDNNKFIHYNHTMLGRPTISWDYTQFRLITAATYDLLSGTVIASYGNKIFRYDPFNSSINYLALSLDVKIYVGGMAFDYIGNNLYLSNTNEKTIEVHSLTTHAKTVFNLLGKPYDIALWPEKGIMYVATKMNKKYKILQTAMNGISSNTQFLSDSFKGPRVSLYFDRDLQKLFLSDQKSGRILSYSDNSFTDLFSRSHAYNSNIPVSLAVNENFIFWTHHHSNELISEYLKEQRATKFRMPVTIFSQNPLVIALRATVTREGDGCQKNNGNCSHICLPSSTTTFICACPPGMMLSMNKHTCTNLTVCPTNEIKCSEHNICIKQDKWCNGIQDCPNGEDESRNCENTGICKKDQFMCKNRMCINLKDRCNSHYDCTDKSDEENCVHQECKNDEFQCREGKCISNFLVCNGDNDCSDFSDELNCDARTCLTSEFKCESGKCISKSLVCDGEMDCPDKSDELGCDYNEECNDRDRKFLCRNGHCVSKLLVCNGINDCGDKSDEHNCFDMGLDFSNCAKNEYSCIYSNKCIPQKARCDGIKDCPKNDDEHHCAYCIDGEFSCNNTKCIPQIWVCNKEDDCGDNSDEKDCSGNHREYIVDPSIECEEFKCSVGICLPFSKVCNNIQDCPDGSDEQGKCNMACAMDNICFGLCYKTPQGAVCGCQDGYRLAADKVSCEDINECELDVCSQICENTVGSFKCSCHDGYVPHSDKVSCKIDGPPMVFIIATDKDIRKVSANLHSIEVIHTLLFSSGLTDLDVNIINSNIYWSNENWGMIKKINIKNEEHEIMARLHPISLSIDWITNNIYFANNDQPNMIMVANLKKQIYALIVKIIDEAKISSVIVDPKNRLLFWSQSILESDGVNGEIYRTDMMGADKKPIVKNIGIVKAMAIDDMKSKLYWSDIFYNCVESSNLDGNQRITIFKSNMYIALDICIFENMLYSLMDSNGQIRKCKLYGDKSCETINIGFGIHTHFAILYKHPYVDNPCEKKNCDYMCVLSANDAVCICKDGTPIEANSSCKNTNNDIISRNTNTDPKYIRYPKIYSIIVIAILIIVVLLYGYFYYQKRKVRSGTKTNVGIRFQNPSYDRQDEVAVTVDPIVPNISPGQHEYTNPIDDKLLKAAKESSAKRSERKLEQGAALEERKVEDIEGEDSEEDEFLISFVQSK